jgi:hypothetical protein
MQLNLAFSDTKYALTYSMDNLISKKILQVRISRQISANQPIFDNKIRSILKLFTNKIKTKVSCILTIHISLD